MMTKQLIIITGFHFLLIGALSSQNLPSLLYDKNINATFSIIAFDVEQQEWGVAVATNNLYVGNSTIYIEPGVGAFSVIAETNPEYASKGFQRLKEGLSIEEAILTTKAKDQEAHYRQVAGIDDMGNAFAFTGEALKYWQGTSNHLIKKHYVVMGNQLEDAVLENMSMTFETTKGTLAERLLASLLAGEVAGGQISGKQSAALIVKGTQHEWYNQIDLRVDHSDQPFQELKTLLDYHYGRIRLNQAGYAFAAGNHQRAQEKLNQAIALLEGWHGMYSKIALLYSRMGEDDQAVVWIKKGMVENPSWKVNLPAFYYLRNKQALANLIQPDQFNVKDWEAAISIYLRLDRAAEAISLCEEVLASGKKSSYLYYLLGQSHHAIQQIAAARVALQKALDMDPSNVEASLLLSRL